MRKYRLTSLRKFGIHDSIGLTAIIVLMFSMMVTCRFKQNTSGDRNRKTFGKIPFSASTFLVNDLRILHIADDLSLPLSTSGNFIVNTKGEKIKLVSINWYGASDTFNVVMGLDKAPLKTIVGLIKKIGFNSVRLPFSNEMLRVEDAVKKIHLKKNPHLIGRTPLQVFDAVIAELTNNGIFVILNNHTTHSQWCCQPNDGNGIWTNKALSSETWMQDWEFLAERYKNNLLVIGADLRNELRADGHYQANWGMGGLYDYRRISETVGNRILKVNPQMLIIVEGLSFASDFNGFLANPIKLDRENKLVFSPHIYAWFSSSMGIPYGEITDYKTFKSELDQMLSPLQKNGAYTNPIWVSEWGFAQETMEGDNPHFAKNMLRYLGEKDFGWAWWPLNVGYKPGSKEKETWGLLREDWHEIKLWDPRIPAIQKLIHAQRR